jgi:hypothetical protein
MRGTAYRLSGALSLVWRCPVGGGEHAEFERTANAIRDPLARTILNAANRMEPYPFGPIVTTKSGAETLVDEALLRHPYVTALAVYGLDPCTGMYSNGHRFGIALALRDRAGAAFGTMNVGNPYRTGDDTKELVEKAVALRAELQARIAAVPALEDVDP